MEGEEEEEEEDVDCTAGVSVSDSSSSSSTRGRVVVGGLEDGSELDCALEESDDKEIEGEDEVESSLAFLIISDILEPKEYGGQINY